MGGLGYLIQRTLFFLSFFFCFLSFFDLSFFFNLPLGFIGPCYFFVVLAIGGVVVHFSPSLAPSHHNSQRNHINIYLSMYPAILSICLSGLTASLLASVLFPILVVYKNQVYYILLHSEVRIGQLVHTSVQGESISTYRIIVRDNSSSC